MIVNRIIWICLFVFLNVSNFCDSTEIFNFNQTNVEKIYVSPDQIVLTNSGIFLIEGHELIPISNISYDDGGLFIPNFLVNKERCDYGHSIKCKRCEGCSDRRSCPFRCRCYH